jgi:hypothetical protein
MGQHTRIVSLKAIVVRASTMTDAVQTDEIANVAITISLVADMNTDIEVEINRGAGLAAGQLTPEDHIVQISAGTMLTAARAVQQIVATGALIEIDAIGLTAHENSVAGLTPSNWQLPGVCVSVDKTSIEYGQVAPIQAGPLIGNGHLRHRREIIHRRH